MTRSSQWHRESSGPFHVLQNELNRLLEEYLQGGRTRGKDAPPTDLDPTAWNPSIDVYDTPEEIVVVAEIPGVNPAAVDLAVTGNVLTLRGVKETTDLPEPGIVLRERRLGGFNRQLTLPNEVDFDKAHAGVNHGVLTVRLPKRSAAKPRTIPIRPG
jgi:HSP20 family protein